MQKNKHYLRILYYYSLHLNNAEYDLGYKNHNRDSKHATENVVKP